MGHELIEFQELSMKEPSECSSSELNSTNKWSDGYAYCYEVTDDYQLHLYVSNLNRLFKLLGTKLNFSLADLNDLAYAILNDDYYIHNNRAENAMITSLVADLVENIILAKEGSLDLNPHNRAENGEYDWNGLTFESKILERYGKFKQNQNSASYGNIPVSKTEANAETTP